MYVAGSNKLIFIQNSLKIAERIRAHEILTAKRVSNRDYYTKYSLLAGKVV